MIQIGIIGMDSTHAVEFARLLNSDATSSARVVAACAGMDTDFPLSVERRQTIERVLDKELNLPILPSVETLLKQVDAVMVLSCDGRCHGREIIPVLAAKKPVFVDKPFCADWREALKVLQAARVAKTPCFSASALRYSPDLDSAKKFLRDRPAKIECFVPRRSEPGHPDLSWYGIHGVEAMYAGLGTGCQTVRRRLTNDEDIITGIWNDGSEGVISRTNNEASAEFRTIITTSGGKKLIRGHSYRGLLKVILEFFESGKIPVPEMEMIEELAFIAAADESRDLNGAPVALSPMLANLEL